jgi:hypothetical protein
MAKIKNYQMFLETIHPNESMDPLKAVQTLIDRRRKIAYLVKYDLNSYELRLKLQELYEDGYKRLDIKGECNPFLVYHPSAQLEAEELRDIAEKYNGYLADWATIEDHKRIGELLEFHEEEIERFIANKKRERGIKESFKKWPVVAGLAAGLSMTNPSVAQFKKPKVEFVKVKEWSSQIQKAKEAVKKKVNRNDNILNKDTIIQKIENVTIEEYSVKHTLTHMYYYYDIKNNKDMIMINTALVDSNSVYPLMVHELTHLIDHHKQVSIKDSLLFKTVSKQEYYDFFKDWRGVELYKKGRKVKDIDMAKLLSIGYWRERRYLAQDSEFSARVSSLYQFLIDVGILKPGERLEKKHIDMLKKWAHDRYPSGKGEQGERAWANFMRNDFIFILPLVDWEKTDEINRIVRADKRKDYGKYV